MGIVMVVATWGSHAGPWVLLFPLLWIGLFATLFFLWWSGRGRAEVRSAEAVLAERYARGEITEDDYRQRLGVLRRKVR